MFRITGGKGFHVSFPNGFTVETCNGCGFPKEYDHDGQEDCPVAVVEKLLSREKTDV